MIPRRWVEAYLRFLLEYRRTVSVIVLLITVLFAFYVTRMRLHTDFFDFYPRYRTFGAAYSACRESNAGNLVTCFAQATLRPGPDPYIQIYRDFRRMFGSANILAVILEVKHGDIFNPDTLQKLDRITKYVIGSKGVNPQQILSIAHPRVKTINNAGGEIQIQPMYYPDVPKTQADADQVRFAVYATPGVRGLLTANDDTAAVVLAGFWEESLDFHEMARRMTALQAQEEDDNHTIYLTGFPWLYTSVLGYSDQVLLVFAATTVALGFLLYTYFHTSTGVWVPIFSGLLSSVWGLGMAVMLGFNLDPLVLVIPVFLTARALSHSVQSMDRYHEEYHRLGDKRAAIVESYSKLFPPAIASIVTDGIALLIVAVAPIPLIQKVGVFASFWVVSIFISVVTLHPIILSYINPPSPAHNVVRESKVPITIGLGILVMSGLLAIGIRRAGILSAGGAMLVASPAIAWFWWTYSETIYPTVTRWVILATKGYRRWVVIVLTILMYIVGARFSPELKVGDITPGAALLFPDHPYNVAYHKWNEKFLGASQLTVIADTKRPDGMKTAAPLVAIQEFSTEMAGIPGASGSVTVVDVMKRVARTFREGDPKWSLIPETPKQIGQLFYVFTQNASVGDLDRFMDPSGRYGTVLTLFNDYSHDVVMGAIDRAKRIAKSYENEDIEFKFAGGLFGILAAVNQAVESSYWINLGLIFGIVYFCLYLTYGSWTASTILMIPVVLSQLAAETLMVLMHIDLNVNSLPIAAAGAGVGVDYGIYHFSRMIDTYDEIGKLDEAVDYATATTGKAIIFTASTMVAATIFWWFSALKFQAEMGLLLALLMAFNTFGGLIVVPAFVKVTRPGFLVNRVPQTAALPRAALAS